MPIQHPAAGRDDIRDGRPGGQKMNARVLNAARNGVGPQTLPPVPFGRRQNFRPLAADLGDPVERLDIVDERGTIEDTHLRHIGRAVAGQAALALDRLDHRAFFAADIGARAPAKVDIARRDDPGAFQRGDLATQDFQHGGVFVAHVDKAGLRLHRPGGDQHPLKEEVRRALKIVAVLERPRLPLIAIDGEVTRPFGGPYERPFAPGREPGAAKAPQARGEDLVLHLIDGLRAAAQRLERLIAACGGIGGEVFIVRDMRMGVARRDGRVHLFRRGVVDMVMPDLQHRRRIAAAHAGRAQNAHFRRIHPVFQRRFQLLRARHFAGKTIADPDCQRGRGRLPFLNHVEMGVEGGDLVNLGLRQTHFLGQRAQMGGGQMAVGVLNDVQMLDQKIAPPRGVAQKRPDLRQRGVVKLPSLRRLPALATA